LESRTIHEDIPCTSCRYNLRGLTTGGRCPECGREIALTLAMREIRGLEREIPFPLFRADRRWLRQLIEGTALAIVAIAMRAIAILMADDLYSWKDPPWRTSLALLAIAWVIEWWACWRLGTPEPLSPVARPSRLPWLLRIAASVYFTTMLLPETLPFPLRMLDVLAIAFSGVAGSCLIYLWIGQLAGRMNRWLPWQAAVLAGIVPTCFFATVLPSLEGYRYSLGQIVRLPTLVAGHPKLLQHLRSWEQGADPWLWIGLMVPLWVLVFLVQFLFALLHARFGRHEFVVTGETPALRGYDS
jgi:hypothetical protein